METKLSQAHFEGGLGVGWMTSPNVVK